MDIVDTLTDRLRVLMKEHRVKAAPLARAAELNESAVRDILRGRSRNPGIVTLKKIASVLNLRPSALFEAGQGWPIVGVVGAEGVITTTADEARAEYVENPFFAYRSEAYAALVDRSGSVAPIAFEGDFLIYQPRDSGVSDQDLGKPCVCALEDGRRLIRVPRLGDQPSRHHLTPLNYYGAPEMNVPLVSAARIALALPAEFAPKLPEPTHHPTSTMIHKDQAAYEGPPAPE
ncbi:MAG: helix-turn-helix transcriptional regulator [Pseudomonadota bacterium]